MNYDDTVFWELIEPVMFNQILLDKTEKELDHLEALVEINKHSKILDVCCGTGRHSIGLAKRGYSVIGIDRISKYIEKALKQAKDSDLNIEFICNDFLNYFSNDNFQIIICLWNSFGFNKDISDDIQFLHKAFSLLEPNGIFILGFAGKEIISRDFQPQKTKQIGKYKLIKYRTLTENGFLNAQWKLHYEQDLLGVFQINQRLYSKNEICSHLWGAGFRECTVYGDFDGSPYNINSKQMLIIAKRV